MSSQPAKVWFITGCSTGFGTSLAEEILSRDGKVIATARSISKLEHLKNAGADIMQVDVTASLDELKKIAKLAHNIYGRIDYLINNAGFVMQGTIEELSPEETQAQFDTNVFGLLNVTRAFLPYMRAAGSGVIANNSSITAWQGFASFSMYCASKWAVSGISESMAPEFADFGIKVCCIEPGQFRSNVLNPGNRQACGQRLQDYDGTAARQSVAILDSFDGNQPGDVRKAAKAIVDVLTRKDGREIPIRLALGPDGYAAIKSKCEETIKLLEEWKDVSSSTNRDDASK